jgi:uncharacterized protein (TIGR00299 family) protein
LLAAQVYHTIVASVESASSGGPSVRVAHFDCFSGASGDMLLGALIDAGVPPRVIGSGIASLRVPITLSLEKVKRCGIAATHVKITAPDDQPHRHLRDIEAILDRSSLGEKPRDLAKRMFRRLAEAEAAVHELPIEKVHFHEVGALDSIADFVGTAIGLVHLDVERFTARSIPVGCGMIDCQHGRMPIPAPATALLLQGVPLAASNVQTELTTPTGAAILTTVVNEWTDSPAMTLEAVGHGAGSRDLHEQPNILRLLIGSAANQPTGERVWVLETNLDDVPGEIVGYTMERLFEAGALDAWTTPVQMKKNRPGVQITVLADDAKFADLEQILFRETGTLGVRRCRYDRTNLPREMSSISTRWGDVKVKAGKPEYEDCARIAREHGIALSAVVDEIKKLLATDENS